jgi:hypothetical protein
MVAPDLGRIIETFIPFTIDQQKNPIAVWQDYIDLLRTVVAPLVRNLQTQGQVRWYSFLVHNQQSGVPTEPNDTRLFVHLRMELVGGVDEASFISRLPTSCLMTRKMQESKPPSLDTVDISYLKDSQVAEGWRILGESSEWVLSILDAHDPLKKVPLQNVAQFLHYTGNQLMVSVVGIPMP